MSTKLSEQQQIYLKSLTQVIIYQIKNDPIKLSLFQQTTNIDELIAYINVDDIDINIQCNDIEIDFFFLFTDIKIPKDCIDSVSSGADFLTAVAALVAAIIAGSGGTLAPVAGILAAFIAVYWQAIKLVTTSKGVIIRLFPINSMPPVPLPW